jgi:hypothetical protein
MSKILVNLTLAVVSEEVDLILETYPRFPYQKIFSDYNLRQELMAYVLSRIPNHHIAMEETQAQAKLSMPMLYSAEQQLKIETLIHQGIQKISREIPEILDLEELPTVVNAIAFCTTETKKRFNFKK